MPTDVVSSIGTGGTYTTIQAWEDAAPANLVTADQRWVGELKNQTFTAGVSVGGSTTDATRYKLLRCEAGASFKDQAGVRTTALRYNTANGAAISTSGTAVALNESYARFEGLQVTRTSYSGDGVITRSGGDNYDFHQCVFRGCVNSSSFNAPATKFRNCLWENYGASMPTFTGRGEFHGCTLVSTNGGTYGVVPNYSDVLLRNTAIFGHATGAVNGSTRAGSDYNATDNASIGGVGSNNLVSQTFSACFESTTNDFRAKDAGPLESAGVADATNYPADISAFTRSATTPTIGAWELSSGGGAAVGSLFWYDRYAAGALNV